MTAGRAPNSAGVPSPCINVCRMNPRTALCEGCLRSIDEIAAWSTMSDEDKRAVWDALDRRRELLPPEERNLR